MGQVSGILVGGFYWTRRSQGRREFAKVQGRENEDREARFQRLFGGDSVGLADGNGGGVIQWGKER